MNDFLQELRTEVNRELGRLDPNSRWGLMISKAADEIERLHAEVKRLSEIYDSGYIDGYDDARENNVDEIERLRAENARLRGAVAAAAAMRVAQKEYFKTRDREALIASKQAEAAFDSVTRAALEEEKK